MASHVENVLTEAQALITVSVPGTVYHFGERFVETREPTPRVVWVPGRDGFGAPSANPSRTRGGGVVTRQAQIQAYLFGGTYLESEALLHATVLALHSVARPLDIDTAEWFNPGWLEAGDGCKLTFRLHVPVTRPDPTYTRPSATDFDTDDSAPGDGYIDAGES